MTLLPQAFSTQESITLCLMSLLCKTVTTQHIPPVKVQVSMDSHLLNKHL